MVDLVRFNTNSKHDFLTYTLTPVFNFIIYDGTTINNEKKITLNKSKS